MQWPLSGPGTLLHWGELWSPCNLTHSVWSSIFREISISKPICTQQYKESNLMKTWFAFYTSLSTSNLQNYKKKQKYFAVIFLRSLIYVLHWENFSLLALLEEEVVRKSKERECKINCSICSLNVLTMFVLSIGCSSMSLTEELMVGPSSLGQSVLTALALITTNTLHTCSLSLSIQT